MRGTFAFYISDRAIKGSQVIKLGKHGGKQRVAWIRVEAHGDMSDTDALDKCQMRPGETGVMNTHSFEFKE